MIVSVDYTTWFTNYWLNIIVIPVGFIFNIYNIRVKKIENKLKQLNSLFLIISFLSFLGRLWTSLLQCWLCAALCSRVNTSLSIAMQPWGTDVCGELWILMCEKISLHWSAFLLMPVLNIITGDKPLGQTLTLRDMSQIGQWTKGIKQKFRWNIRWYC